MTKFTPAQFQPGVRFRGMIYGWEDDMNHIYTVLPKSGNSGFMSPEWVWAVNDSSNEEVIFYHIDEIVEIVE